MEYTKSTQQQSLNLEQMRNEIAQILHEDPAEIRDDDNLIDLGLDSIRAMTLLTRWREAGLRLDFADMAACPELGHWWSLIQKSVQQA